MNIHANKGRNLETAIIASQRNLIRVEKMPLGFKYIAGGKTVPQRGPVDYVGTVVGSGRAITFDAKQCDQATRFPVGNDTHFPEHQRQFLIRQGEAGAIAGLLVEATHEKVRQYLWLDWRHLLTREASVKWDDPRWVRCGDTGLLVDFTGILKAYGAPAAA